MFVVWAWVQIQFNIGFVFTLMYSVCSKYVDCLSLTYGPILYKHYFVQLQLSSDKLEC